jgi:hypothetical protein
VSAPDKKAVFKKIGYKPHAAQWLFHNSTARYKIPACGRRFGKSNMAAAELFVNPRANLFEPNKLFWIAGPKYTHGAKEFRYLRAMLRKLPGRKPGKSLWDECPSKAFNMKQGDMHVELPWDTQIIVVSAQHKDNLIGEGVDGVILSESARMDSDIWPEYIQPTLTDHAPNTWAIFPSTPQGYNWFHNEFQRGVNKSQTRDKDFESWNFPSWLNPYVFPGGENDPEIIKIKARTPEDAFWQEYGASFRSVVGLVYPEFDDELHIYEERFAKPYEYNPDWQSYTAVDFGFTNPFVVLDIQVDPQDNIYIWREHYLAKHSLPQHISLLRGRPDPVGYKVRCGYGDAADPSGCEQLSMALWPVYADNAYKDWARGTDEVKRFLQGEDGQPHLFVSRNCPNTIWEFQNYRLKEQTADQLNSKEEPRKFADHAMDPIRYFLMGHYVLGGGRYSLSDVMDIRSVPTDEGGGGYFTLDDERSAFNLDGAVRY